MSSPFLSTIDPARPMPQQTFAQANPQLACGLSLVVETPENVQLRFELAGPGIRLLAYLIDTLVRGSLLLVGGAFLSIIGLPGFLGLEGTSTGLLLILFFFLEWGYFAVFEGLANGRTLGKAAFGLRVIQADGLPITFWSALMRNLVRAADAIPFYGPGFVTMLLTRNLERMGDLAAGTVVIRERRVRLPRQPMILERIAPLDRDEINRFIPDEATLNTIDELLERRHVLSHNRGHELAAILAGPLAERLEYSGDREQLEEFPMAFLARIYVTFQRSDDKDDRVIQPIRRSPRTRKRRNRQAGVSYREDRHG